MKAVVDCFAGQPKSRGFKYAIDPGRAAAGSSLAVSRVTVDPEICHGKPCVRGLRYSVETILEYLAGGDTADDLLAEFPDLEREDILACHEYSRKLLAAKSVHLTLA